jgi:hypothetical protein
MNLSCQNPVLVIVILWGIAIFTTAFLFRDSPALTDGIVIQGVCMIGSVVYLRKAGGIVAPGSDREVTGKCPGIKTGQCSGDTLPDRELISCRRLTDSPNV